MTSGPFDTPVYLPPTEFGGDKGLIQDHPDHEVSAAEQAGINIRADQDTGIDPVSGRQAT